MLLQRCAQMGAVASVDEDALDKAACWLEKRDILRLRELSPHGRDTARRAIARKWIPHVRRIAFMYQRYVYRSAMAMAAPPRAVEAMARVFGAGCVELSASGTCAPSLAALYDFVRSTNGGLRELTLWSSGISSDLLLVMCRHCPNLIELHGPRCVHTSDEAIVAIAAACPRLEVVSFSDVGTVVSPAERWARHFPRLKYLNIHDGRSSNDPPYRPTQLENISEAARSTSATEVDIEGCHIFPDLIDAIVGTPLGDRLTSLGETEHGMETNIEPDALLAAARGFPRLTELWIPELTNIPNPGWFVELAGIRTFQSFIIESHSATDSQIVAACSRNPVVTLEIRWIRELTRGAIDGIISSQSAATLQDLTISFCEPIHVDDVESYMEDRGIRAGDMLRLVRACPRLSRLTWQREYSNDAWSAQEAQAEITELLKLRGGKFSKYWG